jgi:hypothetical protein
VWRYVMSPEGDAEYWKPEFEQPVSDWLLRGGRGVPLAHSDEVVGLYAPDALAMERPGGAAGSGRRKTPGGRPPPEPPSPPLDGGARKKRNQWRRVKQKTKRGADAKELARLRAQQKKRKRRGGGGRGKGGGDDGGGRGRGKGRGKGGAKGAGGGQRCFSWNRRSEGPCKDLPVGAPCPNNRLHECEKCGESAHWGAQCPGG